MTDREKHKATMKVKAVRRSPLRWVLAVVLPVVLLLGWGIIVANPSFPYPTELGAVRLELPRTPPVSGALAALLVRPDPWEKLPAPLEQARAALAEGRWFDRPAEVQAALRSLRPSLDDFRRVLLAPGCPPLLGSPLDPDDKISYLPLIRGARLLALEAVARAQVGEPGTAARGLLPLVDRLAEIERRCAPQLVLGMVLPVAVEPLVQAAGFLLAHPGIAAAEARPLWDRLIVLERRASPIPDGMRWEARWQREMIAEDFRAGDRERASIMRWPWYDREETQRISEARGRRHVWLASLPPDSPELSRQFPEEAYFERLQRQHRLLGFLRFNASGKILMGIATPAFIRFAVKWHQERCTVAARRGRWMRELQARGGAVPEAIQREPALNPFTRAAFTAGDGPEPCKAPQQALFSTLNRHSTPLPPPPPAPSTGAPPPR